MPSASPTPEMRPTRPIPSIVAQPSRMPSRCATFSRTDWRNGLPLSAMHHAGDMGQFRVQPDLVQIQKPGVLLFQLQCRLFPGLHLLQFALQFLVLFVDPGVGLEVVDHRREPPSPARHRPVKIRHHRIDQRRAEPFDARAVDPPQKEDRQAAATPRSPPAAGAAGAKILRVLCGSWPRGLWPLIRIAAAGASAGPAGVVVDHMPKLLFVFQRFPGSQGNTIQ